MHKRKIGVEPQPAAAAPDWLPVDAIDEVEISSEDEANPIEAALAPGAAAGWKAATPGVQIVRLGFDPPRPIRKVRLVIEERDQPRTQELVLSAAEQPAGPWREIVRQQFNFSPSGATREEENYEVHLPRVARLELTIIPDMAGGAARASLQELRIAG
jgi:hypothetical protein